MKELTKLTSEEIASFFSQSSLLFKAGITPRESMTILYNDCKTESGKKVIGDILAVCNKGENFSTALESADVFPDYVLRMVALGEQSGHLDECMDALAAYYEKEQSISENISSAITYPIVMIVMMLAVIIVLIAKVMPIFQQVFAELGTEMTGFAGSLLRLGNTLNRYSIILLVLLIIIALLYVLAKHTDTGRSISRRFLIKFPLTKRFFESEACQRFASGLAIALSAGMDTYSSLDMVSQMVDNPEMNEKIKQCKELLRQGENFSDALSTTNIFNNLYSQMISVGFRSGNQDEVLQRIADSYEKEANKRIQGILSVLEPTLVIFLSIIVGMILLSVIMPLMGIMSSIG